MRLDDLPESCLRRNAESLRAQGVTSLPGGLTQATISPDHVAQIGPPEKELQRWCETELVRRGYVRSTNENAEDAVEHDRKVAGWFLHLGDPRRNPFAPDLLVFDRDWRRCIAIELKTRSRYRRGQREMIGAGMWRECRDLVGFRVALDEFERRSGE